MSIKTIENTETKDCLISKIRQVVKDEKFRLDAFFFCGFPSGEPNQKLLKVCEKYLETVDNAQPDKLITANMIAELEATVAAKPKVADVDNLLNNKADIKEILANKELLFV